MATAESPTACSRDLVRLMPQLHRWVEAHAGQGRRGDVSLRQMAVLALLAPRPLTVKQLADRLRVTAGVATGLVDRLERSGYVERRPGRTDQRVVRIALTAEGREARQRAEHALGAELAAELAELTPAEMATVRQALGLLGRVANKTARKTSSAG